MAPETELDAYDDYEPCSHICEDYCEDYCDDENGSGAGCMHQHCVNCGGCDCPGYCDDYQTYNLRPAETGGSASYPEGATGAA